MALLSDPRTTFLSVFSPLHFPHDNTDNDADTRLVVDLHGSSAADLIRHWLTGNDSSSRSSDLQAALIHVLQRKDQERALSTWYAVQASTQFDHQAAAQSRLDHDNDTSSLSHDIQFSETTQARLLRPFDRWLSSPTRGTHVYLASTSDGRPSKQQTLRHAMLQWRQTLLGRLQRITTKSLRRRGITQYMHSLLLSMTDPNDVAIADHRPDILHRLCALGLSDTAQTALAYATIAVISSHAHSYDMKVDWLGSKSVTNALDNWIDTRLEPAVRACQAIVLADQARHHSVSTANDRQLWSAMALDVLGRSRTAHLLQYVQMWDQSLGAILDLKEYIRTPEAKRFVVTSFQRQMDRHLLHPGAQTSELLTIYINIIRAFKVMDSRNVLLGKVAEPLRAFLANREDTVQVIAASFLADDDDIQDAEDVCVDLTREVLRSGQSAEPTDRKALDWDDMEWMPDPIDAGPDFERSKRDDIISYMLRLSDQERFNDKMRRILCNRLLKSDSADTEKEVGLVELLKSRRELDKEKLKECEVMLRDMQDSARLLKMVNEQLVSVAADQSGVPTTFSAKVLSSVFWPPLRDAQFSIPAPAALLQARYEVEFTRLKNMRRLQWLSSQGRATVELELQDRTLRLDVLASQASVIYAFGSPTNASTPVSKTKDQLAAELDMDEALLSNALEFWISQRVLSESDERQYTVLETLPAQGDADTMAMAEQTRSAAHMQPAATSTELHAVKSQSAILEENKVLYETCVVHMLTNGGTMDAERIAMMLKMVVPGGFDFGEEGVRYLCAELVENGRLVQEGQAFKIKR